MGSRIRIAHFSPLDGTRGGISTVVANYRQSGLSERFDMRFVATHRDGSRLAKLAQAVRAAAEGLALALFSRPDIIHVHVGDFPSLYRKAAVVFPLLALGTRSVLHFHGANFLAEYAGQPAGRRRFVGWFLRRFDVVLCLGESWRRDLTAEFGLERTIVLPNAVPIPQARAGGRERADQPLNLLFMGLVGERKGVFELLDAVEALRGDGIDVRLSIGGNGDVERLNARLAASPRLAEGVRYLGWVQGEARERAFLAAHAYVLPSHAEGMPMSVIEAMSYRLPIVSCPVGGIPELVDEKSAILVQPGDREGLAAAIRRLAGDERLRGGMAEAAAARVRAQFSLDHHNARLASLYEELYAR